MNSRTITIEGASFGLQDIGEEVRRRMDARHDAREEALSLCRQTTRHSANAIRALHRAEFEAAEDLLATARDLLEQTQRTLADHQDIFYAGFVHDAQKEYAEGCLTLALIAKRPIPSPQDLAVEDAAYLNGLGEAVGELRRHLLDKLREGNIERCEDVLSSMDEAYSLMVSMDYPDALTGGLRRTTDSVRGILERTRGDFTAAVLQSQLVQRLDKLNGELGRLER